MNLFVFGSSMMSTYWNGAATYYRGIYKSLYNRGYRILFAEPDVYDRQQHQDDLNIDYAEVINYRSPQEIPRLLKAAVKADIVIKHSGIGADDVLLERMVLTCRSENTRVVFWDVDAPATLTRLDAEPRDAFRCLIPEYDGILTYGGGSGVVSRYLNLGARSCTPIYNGLDPQTHHPVALNSDFTCDLAFVGHRLPDREKRVDEFFFKTAALAPTMGFVLGGEGWADKQLPPNVRWIGHVSSNQHNSVNCSAKMVLNVNRESMADVGFSPPTRVFEAAGAGACVVTDLWDGIDHFFSPGLEILCASSSQEVADHLSKVTQAQARAIGEAMRQRALREHTYDLRAREVHSAFQQLFANKATQHSGTHTTGSDVSQQMPT